MIEPALLQVRGLCKTYQNRTGLFRRQAVEAIKPLSFDLGVGQTLAIVGEAGERVVITRRGKAVAELRPVTDDRTETRLNALKAAARFKAEIVGSGTRPFMADELLALRDRRSHGVLGLEVFRQELTAISRARGHGFLEIVLRDASLAQIRDLQNRIVDLQDNVEPLLCIPHERHVEGEAKPFRQCAR